jgi:hypothetical protein
MLDCEHIDEPSVSVRVNQKVMTATTRVLLAGFAWDIFIRSSYSPDLAPNDFHLFTHLKQFLSGMHMSSDEEEEAK